MKIEETYNPITYREHLKNVFAGQIKNEIMRGNLTEVTKKVENVDKETKLYEKHLEKKTSLVILGRTSDSPSTKLGKIQKRLDEERQKKSMVSNRSLGKQAGYSSQRSFSQNSSPQ
jgi:GTPase involved in cell partitioning and DNA repair